VYVTGPVEKQQRVDVCTEYRQIASDDETFLSRVITGDLESCDFFLFPKMKLKLKRRRCDINEEIQAESQRALDTLTEKRSKNGGDRGTGVYRREGTTSRMMAPDRSYGEF
jgi:hypothetical protein